MGGEGGREREGESGGERVGGEGGKEREGESGGERVGGEGGREREREKDSECTSERERVHTSISILWYKVVKICVRLALAVT